MFLDDEETTARIRTRRSRSTLWVAVTAVTACVLMMTALVGTAGAEELSHLSQVITPQLLLEGNAATDHRVVYGAMMLVFSVAAAGLWCKSFRGTGNRARSHGGRISQS